MRTRALLALAAAAAASRDDDGGGDGGLAARLGALPPGFAFGVATSAYQIEGGASSGGRGASIWDAFAARNGTIAGGADGRVADDDFHRFREDVALAAAMNVDSYRLSLAWPRLFPEGVGQINAAGVAFYRAVFAELARHGIAPMVTLYHWDLPEALEESYGGWLGRGVVADFAAYADACFAAFPEVDTWTTFNEPLTFVGLGYGAGVHAPGRCSDRLRCAAGDSDAEPLVAAHHVLLAHAAAVAKFRARFASHPRKRVGAVNCGWMAWPYRPDTPDDVAAAESFMEAQWGWFLDPVVYGDYPDSLKARAGAALPRFTAAERAALEGSVDFVGVNYYTARYVGAPGADLDAAADAEGIPFLNGLYGVSVEDADGAAVGPRGGPPWLYANPRGLRDVLLWLAARYPARPLVVTENGCAQPHEDDAVDPIDDRFRVDYVRSHLSAVADAIAGGAAVAGYYAWSLLDNFEWADGYGERFGLVYVDYATQRRTPKRSARVYGAIVEAARAARPALLPILAPPAVASPRVLALAVGLCLAFALAVVAVVYRSSRAPKRGVDAVELPEFAPLPYEQVF